jgi:metacaspase-1
LNAGVSYARGDVQGLISTGMSLFFKATRGKKAREKSRRTKSSPANVIQFSGCKDYETAKDTTANVCFTNNLIELTDNFRGKK